MDSSLPIQSNTPLSSTREKSDAQSARKSEETDALNPSNAKQRLNAQILQSSMEVSIGAGDKSLELVYRSAIDKINEILEPEFGPDALQSAASQDNSPEATAQRILSISTGFYEAYAAQRPGEDSDKVATDFINTIRGGFEKGFKEAADILEGLSVLNGEIAVGIQKTYELVQKGYDDFLASKLTPKENAVGEAA